MSNFVCELCGNEDERYIGFLNGKPYCRRCISFKGESAKEVSFFNNQKTRLYLKYPLSNKQKEVSENILVNFKNGIDTLVYAVCGAGKTELVYKTIEYSLKQGYKVGFCIPRRDVVIELSRRIKLAFPSNIVTSVYGGNTNLLEADIVCLTTHQLYRYNNYFDLLILDELDAFPYKGNDVLNSFFKRAVRGHYVLLSATPDEKILDEFSKDNKQVIRLFSRYHKHIIPVPVIVKKIFIFKEIFLIKKLIKFKADLKPCLIFVPTIDICENLYNFVKIFVKPGYFVHSKCVDREETIDLFREKKYMYLVTTAVLERGVTLKNLQVIIYNAEHDLYNKSALIQISGRVGRVIGAEDGEIIYLCKKKTKAMDDAVKFTKEANNSLQGLL